MHKRSSLALAFATGLLFVPSLVGLSEAEAGVSTEAHVQYGVGINGSDGVPTGYGFGFGGRVGYGLGPIYLGAFGDYYLGSSEGPLDASSFLIGGEVGYEISLPTLPLAFRPRLGMGFQSRSFSLGGISGSAESFAVVPGVTAKYDIAPFIYTGVEVELIVPTEGLEVNEKSLSFGLLFGARFM